MHAEAYLVNGLDDVSCIHSQEYPKLFAMLWKRLTDIEHVMHVQKALMLLEYLLRYGSERIIQDARRRSRDVANLQKYKHYDEHNQDDAKEARAKAKTVHDLLTDEQHLAEERAKAQKLRESMKGFGSNDYQYATSNYSSGYGYGEDDDNNPNNHRSSAPTYSSAPVGRDRKTSVEDPYGESRSSDNKNGAEQGDEEKEKKKKKKKHKDREADDIAPTKTVSSGHAGAGADPFASSANDGDPFASSVIPAGLQTSAPVAAAPVEKPKKEHKEKKHKKKEKNDAAGHAAAAAAPASASSAYAAVAKQQASFDAFTSSAPAQDNTDLSGFANSPTAPPQYTAHPTDMDFLTGQQHVGY